jgi:hypothetical protein
VQDLSIVTANDGGVIADLHARAQSAPFSACAGRCYPHPDVTVQVERCLDWIRRLSDRLVDDLRTLSTDEWEGRTNCPPWRVRNLPAHIVLRGEAFVDNICRGLAGSVEPPAGHRSGAA